MVYAYFDYTRLCFKLHKKLRRNQTVTWFIKYHTAFFRKFQSLTRKGAPRMSISYHELKDRILSETELAALLKGFASPTAASGWTIVKYVVRDGDTIDDLSARFKIPRSLILKLNALSPGSPIKQGEVLLLPEFYT